MRTKPVAADAAADELVTRSRRWYASGAARGASGPARPGHTTAAPGRLTGLLDDGEHRLGEIADRRGVDRSVVSRPRGRSPAWSGRSSPGSTPAPVGTDLLAL